MDFAGKVNPWPSHRGGESAGGSKPTLQLEVASLPAVNIIGGKLVKG